MPATGREIITSRSYSTDSGGRTVATRRWRTEATSRAEAATYLATAGVSIGSAHPEFSNLFLDSIAYEPNDDGTYDVGGNYSSTNLFVLESTNKKNLPSAPYYRVNFSTYDYTVDVPFGVRITHTVANATPPTQKMWVPNKQKVYKTDVTLTIEVRPPRLGLSGVSLIAQQAYRIHTFNADGGAGKWLFIGGNVSSASDTEDFVKYQWRRDSGDLAWQAGVGPIANKNAYDPQLVSSEKTVLFPEIERKPHEVLLMKQADNGPTFWPVFYAIMPYSLNANGWTTLPGLSVVPNL
jgi:hypothetical protein